MSPRAMRRAREREVRRETKRKARLARRGLLTAGLAVGAGAICAPGAAQAAPMTFTVNSLDDHPADGCDPAPGDCTLRDAVDAANSNAGADTITFQSGLSGTIDLTEGQIGIYEALTINGPGADQITVDAQYGSRIFYVNPTTAGEDVSISGLSLVHGVYAVHPVVSGGAIESVNADLTLANDTLRHNLTFGRVVSGGAVESDNGSLTISGSVLANNQALGKYGAEGGAVESNRGDLS